MVLGRVVAGGQHHRTRGAPPQHRPRGHRRGEGALAQNRPRAVLSQDARREVGHALAEEAGVVRHHDLAPVFAREPAGDPVQSDAQPRKRDLFSENPAPAARSEANRGVAACRACHRPSGPESAAAEPLLQLLRDQ